MRERQDLFDSVPSSLKSDLEFLKWANVAHRAMSNLPKCRLRDSLEYQIQLKLDCEELLNLEAQLNQTNDELDSTRAEVTRLKVKLEERDDYISQMNYAISEEEWKDREREWLPFWLRYFSFKALFIVAILIMIVYKVLTEAT